MVTPSIGILALQGAFDAHAVALHQLGATTQMVRSTSELENVAALVMPGGESSAMLRLMENQDLAARVQTRILAGMPVLATCAGVILLAENIEPPQPSLRVLHADVVRNAYGRQLYSSVEKLRLDERMGPPLDIEGVLIRAPRIVRTGRGVTTLAWLRDDPVLVQQGKIIAATFHPELSDDLRVHQRFLDTIHHG